MHLHLQKRKKVFTFSHVWQVLSTQFTVCSGSSSREGDQSTASSLTYPCSEEIEGLCLFLRGRKKLVESLAFGRRQQLAELWVERRC